VTNLIESRMKVERVREATKPDLAAAAANEFYEKRVKEAQNVRARSASRDTIL
jgi:hypothetical protein